jgi:glutaredoxin
MFATAVRRQGLHLTLYTSKTCSLCVEAKQALERVRKQIPFTLTEVDIYAKGNEEHQIYMYDIPVVHLNGKHLVQHRVNEAAVTEALRQALAAQQENTSK